MKNVINVLLKLIFMVILFSGLSTNLYAQRGIAGAFLRMGIGARANALGGAYTALANGIEASYYNPAGLPLLTHKEIMASFRVLSLDRQFTFLGFGIPIHPQKKDSGQRMLDGGLALAWLHAGVGNIDGRNSDGQHFGDLSNSEDAFIFSFALSAAKYLSLGLSVKVLWNRFPDLGLNGETISASGVGFDFGALFSPKSWLTLGIAVKDINSKYTWNTNKLYDEKGSESINRFPQTIRAGVAFKIPEIQQFTFSFDFEDSKKFDSRLLFGAEGLFENRYVVRVGLADGSITAGGGYQFQIMGNPSQLNYAFVAQSNGVDDEHIFTWVFQF